MIELSDKSVIQTLNAKKDDNKKTVIAFDHRNSDPVHRWVDPLH
ncbi:MAG: hypothetical protein VB113_14000 [Acetobacterium wieringae]|nr:hypothetical protein [Acetobacterium wieringae]